MICPLADICAARAGGRPADFPRRQAKTPKPRKQTIAYWLEHEGDVLLVRRPKTGMLGGMLALPTGSWGTQVDVGEGAPVVTRWFEGGSVEHVFTHFALSVRLLCGNADARRAGEIWWPADRLEEAGLPTLFAKLARRGLAWRSAA
jgi:A/G-specific adenine glycosylase